MGPLFSIGRAGAVGGTDAAASPGAKRAGSPSFGKSLEYVIGASQADHQRNAIGHRGPHAGVQQTSQPFTAVPAARVGNAVEAGGTATQSTQCTAEPQVRKSDSYGYGSPSGYYFDSVPSTLDPGSMAFLVAWLGGSVDGQSVRQEQQAYLETYRQRYPDGAPGAKSYITAATNYLTGTS